MIWSEHVQPPDRGARQVESREQRGVYEDSGSSLMRAAPVFGTGLGVSRSVKRGTHADVPSIAGAVVGFEPIRDAHDPR